MSYTTLTDAERPAYGALRSGAVLIPRSDQHHLSFTGPKAADVLTGLVTNHVLGLAECAGQYAAALTAKGKIVADLRLVRTGPESFLTSTRTPSWAGWRGLVRKYVNPRLARYTEEPLAALSLFGPAARAALSRALITVGAVRHEPDAEPNAETPAHQLTRYRLGEVTLFRVVSPELLEIWGEELLAPADTLALVLDALRTDPTVVEGTDTVLEVARIAVGRPRWGQDMDDTTIPQEANLGDLGALHFDKGCYTGQETVARIHFRGHVNRHLRLLHSDTPLPVGAELQSGEGKLVGDIRSSAVTPDRGPIALAMVRRELAPGATVYASHPDRPPATILR
jgi:folate-binding protein YgfZ